MKKFFAKLKAITNMVFSNMSPWSWLLPRTKYDYASEVGDGLGSSTIMAPVLWIARTFPEAPVVVMTDEGIDHENKMSKLIQKPNEFYSGITLMMATMISFPIAGNAYWLKLRNNQMAVKELWYVPHWLITPKWSEDGTDYISHYLYNPGGEAIKIDREDVVHFRYGLDPRNIRKGLSPLGSVLREVFTDDEAANFSASLLKNLGIPGLLIMPKTPGVQPEDKEAVKQWFKDKFGGDRRGEPLVMGAPTEIKQMGFSPSELDLGKLREIPEERVTAVLGIPAAVVGFGTGLQQTKVGATMAELREMAYESCIIPMQRLISSELQNQLLPDFETNLEKKQVAFDLSNVRVLQEDENKRAERWNTMVKGGWVMVSEGRRAVGLESEPSDDVYLRSFNTIEVTKSGQANIKIDNNGYDKTFKYILPVGIKFSAEDQRKLIIQLNKDLIELSKIFEGELEKAFNTLGRAVVEAWELIAEQYGVDYSQTVARAYPAVPRLKQEEIYVDLVGDAIQVESFVTYETHYLRVAKRTVGTINTIVGLGVNLTDQAELRIIAESGTRLGLLDLSKQVKKSLFRALTEAREEGLGPPAAARRVRDLVSAGPWTSADIRSRVIARTETKFAQNVSSIETYKIADTVSQVRIVDGQLLSSDDFCINRDGDVVSFAEAEILAMEEHPNGTLSFSPVVE